MSSAAILFFTSYIELAAVAALPVIILQTVLDSLDQL
jgi:hypothetical protein